MLYLVNSDDSILSNLAFYDNRETMRRIQVAPMRETPQISAHVKYQDFENPIFTS